MDKEDSATLTCALNSTLIGMYKGNVLGFMRAHTLIHPDIFVNWRAFWFERTPCFRRKSTQVFVHEAPGDDCMLLSDETSVLLITFVTYFPSNVVLNVSL